MKTAKQLGWWGNTSALAGVMALGLMLGLAPRPARAAMSCVGDCDNSGEVTVDELILLVNIDLGVSDPSACSNGIPPGTDADILLIVQAVNIALTQCPAPATATPTTTPTPLKTPAGGCSSPNPLNVAGTYNLSISGVDSSTCPSEITTAIEDGVSGMQGTDTFTQDGALVTLEPGISGCVDDQGNVTATLAPQSQSQGDCTVTVGGGIALHLKNNPSHGSLTQNVSVSSGCQAGFSQCTVVIGVDVNELSFAQVGRDGGDALVSATARTVLDATVNAQP